jgi:hypothetical protein
MTILKVILLFIMVILLYELPVLLELQGVSQEVLYRILFLNAFFSISGNLLAYLILTTAENTLKIKTSMQIGYLALAINCYFLDYSTEARIYIFLFLLKMFLQIILISKTLLYSQIFNIQIRGKAFTIIHSISSFISTLHPLIIIFCLDSDKPDVNGPFLIASALTTIGFILTFFIDEFTDDFIEISEYHSVDDQINMEND